MSSTRMTNPLSEALATFPSDPDPLYRGEMVEWYHHLYYSEQQTAAEVQCFLHLLEAHGCRKLLEIAGGSGRLAVPLARAGMEVTLSDLSLDMLEYATQTATRSGVTVQVLQRDMRHTSAIPGKFDCVLLATSALLYMCETKNALLTLRGCRERLRGRGILIIDVANYWAQLVAGKSSKTQIYRSVGEREMTVESTAEVSPHLATADATQIIRRKVDAHSLLDVKRQLRFRILNYLELQALLSASGMAVSCVYGGYDMQPLGLRSHERLIVVAQAN